MVVQVRGLQGISSKLAYVTPHFKSAISVLRLWLLVNHFNLGREKQGGCLLIFPTTNTTDTFYKNNNALKKKGRWLRFLRRLLIVTIYKTSSVIGYQIITYKLPAAPSSILLLALSPQYLPGCSQRLLNGPDPWKNFQT